MTELVLDNVKVPVENLIGRPGKGWDVLMTGGADMRVYGPGTMSVGLAQGALDYALRYSKERVQFGQPIADLQGIPFMLADIAIQLEAARSLLYRTTAVLDSNDAPASTRRRLVSSTKCFASDMAMKVTTDAVQILGGYGVIKDHPVERMMRDAKMIQVFEGTNQVQRVIVAKALLSCRAQPPAKPTR